MSDDLAKSLLPCPSTFCWSDEKPFFDWDERSGGPYVRVGCGCGMRGPVYQRNNHVEAAVVATEAWNKLPRMRELPFKMAKSDVETLSKREMTRLRKVVQKSDIYYSDRMRLEGIVREYFFLVAIFTRTMPAIIKSHQEATDFVSMLINREVNET